MVGHLAVVQYPLALRVLMAWVSLERLHVDHNCFYGNKYLMLTGYSGLAWLKKIRINADRVDGREPRRYAWSTGLAGRQVEARGGDR